MKDLWFWENQWCAILKGLRDGRPHCVWEQLRSEPRRLSRHPLLRWEFRNEIPVSLKVAEVKIPGIPPERELWEELLWAASPEVVRAICLRSRYWLNPKQSGKPFVEILSTKADQFLAAKNDRRFPASGRPSSDDKRLRYLSRAMAGITVRRSYRTAIDLLGAQRRGLPLDREGYDTGTIRVPLELDLAVG